MVRRWLPVLMMWVVLLGAAACGDSSGKSEPVEEVTTDTAGDTGNDTGVDTSTQKPTGPSRVGLVSGAGQRESANYKLNITVGSPVTSHRLQSSQYKMTLGVGATP